MAVQSVQAIHSTTLRKKHRQEWDGFIAHARKKKRTEKTSSTMLAILIALLFLGFALALPIAIVRAIRNDYRAATGKTLAKEMERAKMQHDMNEIADRVIAKRDAGT